MAASSIGHNKVCSDLAASLVHGRALAPQFESGARTLLPGIDFLSVALVGLRLDHLLHYPLLDSGKPVQGAVAAVAKCQSGTAAWLAFQTGRRLYGDASPAGISAYADWALLSSEVATVATIPIDTANGLVGTATFASAKGAVLDTESICWFAALLGQCLVHCKCKADLQLAMSHASPADHKPQQVKDCWEPRKHEGLAHAPGSRTFTLSCQVCAAINPVTVTPADLGLQAVVPHPVSTPAAGPKITSANIGDAWRLQRVSKQQQLPKVDGQRPEATSSRQSPKLAHELRPSCPPSALTHGQQQWQWCWLPALGLLAVVVAACSTEQGLERLHATSQWHWQCLQLLSCCLGMATLGCIAALGLLQRQHVTVSGLGLWMLAHAWLPCGWHLWALLATLVRSLG